ncbi:MAG: EAL domain-containing protein, partial [Acidimicrobiales bacterium]
MTSHTTNGQWRGWGTLPGGGRAVTSSRLGGDAPVRNRMFPKIRSWLALGAPLELLSPLSVMRGVYVLAAVVGPLVALAGGLADFRGWVLPGVTAALLVTAVALVPAHQLGERQCQALCWLVVVASGLVVWHGHGDSSSILYLLLPIPAVVCAGLFLRWRALIALHLLIAISLWAGLAVVNGEATAIAASVAGSLAMLFASLTCLVLVRSGRRRGLLDADTGLPNGYGLAEKMATPLSEVPCVVASVVVSGLDAAREAVGYQVGTELLRRAVEDIGQVLPPDAVIGRVEGDELTVVLAVPDAPRVMAAEATVSAEAALVVANDAAQSLGTTLVQAVGSGRYLVGEVEVSMRAHVGVALAPWDGTDLAELARRASAVARRAETNGRMYGTWDGDHATMTSEDLSLLAELRTAGDRGQLWLAYQPQIDATTGRPVSVEALLRWKSPTYGEVQPGRFIGLAERTGLIDRLTEWLLGEALDAQARWRAAGLDIHVSINLSAKTITRPDLGHWILSELESRQLPSSCLTVEITETAATADLVEAGGGLNQIRQRGVRVAIDDFGIGYTSLAVLPHLPLD